MKILICTDTFYPGIGGTEAASLGYAQQLVKEGHEVLLACPDYHRKDEREYSFLVLRLPSISISSNVAMVLIGRSRKYIEKMAEFRPDVIQTESWAGMARIALRLGKKLGVPVVMTMHTKLYLSYMQATKSRLLTRAFIHDAVRKLYRADAVVTVAECMREELSACGFKNSNDVLVIRNGSMFVPSAVSEEDRISARRELGLSDDENILLFVGRIVKIKNIEFLLDAFQTAKEYGFHGKFLLIGSGEDEAYFRKTVKQRGLSDEVIFTGLIESRERMRSVYASADLFVFASEFDNDPLVVTEAASRGVPTLAISGFGCGERISNNVNGFTVSYDTQMYGKKIAELFQNKQLLHKVGSEALNSIPSDWSETVSAYLSLYRGLKNGMLENISVGGGYYAYLDSRVMRHAVKVRKRFCRANYLNIHRKR